MRAHVLRGSSWILLAACAGVTGSARAQCLDLVPGFGLPGPSDAVFSLATLDAGHGSALYAGGAFTDVEGLQSNHVAMWDGSTWTALGEGVDGDVRAFAVFDDGTGPAVYAGGEFANRVAKWDGAAWSAVGSGLDGTVLALAVFDDGTGPALYAGGEFANHVAKWNGAAWSAVGSGMDGTVLALAVFDDGTGPALYAGGEFTNHVGRWDGAAWSVPGSGLASPATSLRAFDDGSGPVLCAGGQGVSAWDGSAWSPLGTGGPACVLALESFDDGSGPALFASGRQGCGSSIERWDGSSWSPQNLSWYPFAVHALSVFDGGSGAALFAGSEVLFVPYSLPLYLARLDGSTWVPVGAADGTTGGVLSLLSFDDGSGPSLFAGGSFDAAGSTGAGHIARFDGASWHPLDRGVGDGTPGATSVQVLAAFDDGSGPALYAGGNFTSAGGVAAQNVARWDGAHWSPLASGVAGGQSAIVRAMAVFDDGSGPALFVGGEFNSAGGMAVGHIAKWDGSQWSALGSGLTGGPFPLVSALAVFDDGTGAALYVAGTFTTAGGVPAACIAKWNGSTWSSLRGGLSPAVGALAVFDDGAGPALYASNAGGASGRVFKWERSAWMLVGNQELGECGVASMTAYDDGSGPSLFVCTSQCTKGYPSILRWDGFQWLHVTSPPTLGVLASMFALDGTVDPAPGLYLASGASAAFQHAPFSGIARYVGCAQPGVPFCAGDGTSGPCPCGNTGVTGHGCENSAATGGALLAGSGHAGLSDDTFTLTASSERESALSIWWQSDAHIQSRIYGDGLGCIGGATQRLYAHRAVAGIAVAPQGTDGSVSQVSTKRGVPIAPGTTRVYQVFYRDPSPSFCPPPRGATFNTTNGLRAYWRP